MWPPTGDETPRYRGHIWVDTPFHLARPRPIRSLALSMGRLPVRSAGQLRQSMFFQAAGPQASVTTDRSCVPPGDLSAGPPNRLDSRRHESS